MWRYVIRRILWLPIILFVVSFITFLLFRVVPGDPVIVILGDRYEPDSIAAINLIESDNSLIQMVKSNTEYFRGKIKAAGFTIKDGDHPIVPIMLNDAKLAQNFSKDMLECNIYVIGFSYPVVPKDQARIRVQISASHTLKQINQAVKAFVDCGKKLRII